MREDSPCVAALLWFELKQQRAYPLGEVLFSSALPSLWNELDCCPRLSISFHPSCVVRGPRSWMPKGEKREGLVPVQTSSLSASPGLAATPSVSLSFPAVIGWGREMRMVSPWLPLALTGRTKGWLAGDLEAVGWDRRFARPLVLAVQPSFSVSVERLGRAEP